MEVQNDGAESAIFQQLFQKWTVPNRTSGLGKTYTVGSVGKGWPGRGGVGQEPGMRPGEHPDLPPVLLPRHASSMHAYPGSGLPRWGGDTRRQG